MSPTSPGLRTKERSLADKRRAAAYALWHLGAALLAYATREPALLALLCVVALVAMTWRARKTWTPGGGFGWANALTWSRILATALVLALPMQPLVQASLAALIFALDGVDGAIARALATSSEFGASLDKECDAFFVLSLGTLLWVQGIAGPWVLIAGLWRYAYGLLVALRPTMPTAPRSNWGRYSYSTGCVCLVLALLPQTGVAVPLAAMATVVISASFLRSLRYSLARS